ncbi:uncharacterized protein CANTADRAFT_339219 [Suhomyces tanzawaensis NRRL Y-17324]|uniref:N-acetyltransferase domain-containing protein n=1 Tax=Suhomyces tanzawaensis NRRL Y-17324 TaxID=984487 RepID=A0A1E4SP26_9ASCO|nr:uncharacterized protein CANTADRAFT_339219 [Suhomyces tanzawaensis NRRL Y-17324]ODV81238.1 hypothetical protein CANTADRAFT_339219 [Suhomyces tanzawaensis NRRL Y-17324]
MDFYKQLPFADGTFALTTTITTPLVFRLEKNPLKTATLLPVHDPTQVPPALLDLLHHEFNYIVEEGLTYPHHVTMTREEFIKYWFAHFVAILIEGDHLSFAELHQQPPSYWNEVYLGNFYIKPNYIGRCSHVCNAGFLVNHQKRGLGLGKELGKRYLAWAKQLGYAYSVFNLVFETNVASLRIWDGLGFERIGYVKNVAMLRGMDSLVGAYMFGKDLLEYTPDQEHVKA